MWLQSAGDFQALPEHHQRRDGDVRIVAESREEVHWGDTPGAVLERKNLKAEHQDGKHYQTRCFKGTITPARD